MTVVKINNQKCVHRLSIRNLLSAKTRCIVSVIAIALTTILFTSLFTILMTIAKGFEESNFRQVGTYSHAEFKRLTKEQYDELRTDEDIVEYGLRRVAGVTTGEYFDKEYAEVSYMDKNYAKWGYCIPDNGTLPKENTNEATVDTRVLDCLGIEPKIGKSFTLEIDLDGIIVTEDFILSGWWEYDEAAPASHVLIPESRLEELFTKYNVQFYNDYIGKYGLDVMLKSDYNIEGQMVEILERHGFNDENPIDIGVNWGYMGENITESLDFGSVATIAVILIFIIFTGYLIIYNIFRISVANDIRHYGMLKTIGTTQTQIKSIVQTQALILSAIGIPIGLLVGWITGSVLCPVVMSELNIYNSSASISPWIFVFSALFAWITVMISCFRPAKTAGKVSPVEALRYTEQASGFSSRNGKKGVSLFGMAAARLTGSKGKTVLVVVSLALSIVTFTLTFILANSFNMEKYLSDQIQADFLVADSKYFAYRWNKENAISLEDNEFLRYMDGVTDSFVTYAIPSDYYPQAYFSEKAVREILTEYEEEEEYIDSYISRNLEADGTIAQSVQLLGVEDTALSKLKVYEGDLAKLSENGYIAVNKNDHIKLGDKITFLYTDKLEYVNTQTGTTYTDFESIPLNKYEFIEINEETHKVEYEIAAVIEVPYTFGYRFSIDTPLFITSSEDLFAQSEYCKPLYIAFDTTEETEPEMEKFLADYTKSSTLSYTSRAIEEASFESFKRMFVILGAALSIIVGLIGVLNFINTMITSINSRQREIAALQAMGMTGRQLCSMLVWEGIIYIGGSAITALILNLITIPLGKLIEEIFWFCDYSFTILPLIVAIPVLAIIGIIIPVITYKTLIKKSIVERLRGNE